VKAAILLLALLAGDPAAVLTGVRRTDHFDVRFRPGSRAAAAAEWTADLAERDFDRIVAALKFKPEVRFLLHIYDDVEEIGRITGTTGTGGFSWDNQMHVPYDNDQTLLHEMVHVVAYRLPKAGDEPRNLFFAEGLANAVLEHVHGVPVHAVAAFYRRRKELPPLAEMTGAPDFYAWLGAHPGFNAYDVAGSFLLHLLEEHGAEKVKKYYAGMSAKKAFGADEAALEKSWLAALDRYVLQPEVEALLRQRAGEKVEFPRWEPDYGTVLGKPGDWISLSSGPVRPVSGLLAVQGGAIAAKQEGDWQIVEFGEKTYGDAAVRAKFAFPEGCGALQVRLGPGCQAMLVGNGTFVWRDSAATATTADTKIGGRKEVDLVLVRRGGTAEVWVEGKQVVTGPCGPDPALPGFGAAGLTGSVEFRDLAVRDLAKGK
jgi:hypothetical protein